MNGQSTAASTPASTSTAAASTSTAAASTSTAAASTSTAPASVQQPVQNPLTLVMTIKSPQDYEALHALLSQMQNMPPENNPINAALAKIGTVHFARFVFLDETKLAVITTYDDSFDTYINDFVTEIGDVFNALLSHMADAPPLPVQQHRQEFLDYVRRNDLRCFGTLYSAYPTQRVLDIQANAAQS